MTRVSKSIAKARALDALCRWFHGGNSASDLPFSLGGPRGTRTHNPRIKSPLLCQLS